MYTLEKITFLTEQYNQLIPITQAVRDVAARSQIRSGWVGVVTLHTTTGILVNERVECLEVDIQEALERLVPEDHPYMHARILPSYGSTAGNPTGHLKSMLTGNHCLFPLHEGEMVMGEAQEIYFCEFDGPARRTVVISVLGE
ncbi:secondary thiamine-phosphate synthase enzyme YjbQ [Levilinea saccharolytica]|uniref:Secondary thiamine-phosphate synthase enzyme n=1 Tax=Levilinea saccharolytica TaxID=229921 RepID=A0A0P6Y766_9CHLR|nr:secondary thiamine-phosphate synthase enzyme YjbQ [Levilinea saccharolytica]KPL77433.1 secondary thiamine-phosphate synthase enzyme [Levilinea saccharolytica]GAP18792.1 secondary thiamine-phosphate synthase enzyme [Levilinea saccharolytica]